MGKLQVSTFSQNVGMPLTNTMVQILDTITGRVVETLYTNNSGQTDIIDLMSPSAELSLSPGSAEKPYAEYDIEVLAQDHEPKTIEGVQIFSGTTAIQNVDLFPRVNLNAAKEVIRIKPNTLWIEGDPKIPEDDTKSLPPKRGFSVLDKPVIPQTIVVHNGAPNNTTAKNYYVPYKDYIKNVASSELYATWPDATLRSNILAIISFSLNRVYTEWYRNMKKNFTITSSTAYDHAFVYGRNIFAEISLIVDDIFTTYITKPNIRQPLLTQYCDGRQSVCPKWMTQWGSKSLGDKGYSAERILKYYYGDSIYLTKAEKVAGIPSSFSGKNLQTGSRGKDVLTIQNQLNAISNNYPAIKKIKADSVFGTETINSVKKFQTIFHLPASGIVDFPTWYKISQIFVAVTKIAELS